MAQVCPGATEFIEPSLDSPDLRDKFHIVSLCNWCRVGQRVSPHVRARVGIQYVIVLVCSVPFTVRMRNALQWVTSTLNYPCGTDWPRYPEPFQI